MTPNDLRIFMQSPFIISIIAMKVTLKYKEKDLLMQNTFQDTVHYVTELSVLTADVQLVVFPRGFN